MSEVYDSKARSKASDRQLSCSNALAMSVANRRESHDYSRSRPLPTEPSSYPVKSVSKVLSCEVGAQQGDP